MSSFVEQMQEATRWIAIWSNFHMKKSTTYFAMQ